jgi:hypothetical protein
MTLREIEDALTILISRHRDLDDGMLVTLLQAGGWDQRSIQEAVNLFHLRKSKAHLVTVPKNLLPELQTEPLLPPQVETDHLLVDHQRVTQEPLERQSLISSGVEHVPTIKEVKIKKEVEPPHNLPLRPFESAPHIWEFSRYKEMFYGNTMPEPQEEAVKEELPVPLIPEPKPQPVIAETKKEPEEVKLPEPVKVEEVVAIKEPVKVQQVKIAAPSTSVHLTKELLAKKEEKLVLLAFIMLVLILLILGYMYSNGRL